MLSIVKHRSFWALSFFLCFQAGLASGQDLNTPLQMESSKVKGSSYHFARSAAELALEKIIRLDEADRDLYPFVIGRPSRKAKLDGYYNGLGLLTDDLLKSVRKAEVDSVQQNCAGQYIAGEMCGIDIHVPTCAQDLLEDRYLFRTQQQTQDHAIVAYRWPGYEEPVGTYRLIKLGDRWVLDGISCFNAPNYHFNDADLLK